MKCFSLSLILLFSLKVFAQTNISGVINDYASVSSISGTTLTVSSSANFVAGDLALIIQMQGATIDETNSADFGDVVDLNNAGNYEFISICSVLDGTTLTTSPLQRSYDPSGAVQLVRVPVYDNANITGMLTADPWNGSIGGVLALQCTGDLTMNAGIDLDGLGYIGAITTTSPFACQWWFQPSDYFYDISTGEGAKKGEGLASYIPNKTGGRGAQANGGGGGNDHNTGGGGGANAGSGGQGGNRIAEGTFFCSGTSPGVGGKPYVYNTADNKVFMGGAGGAGHENNVSNATPGGSGAGLCIIKADRIIGNGQSISAQGESVGFAYEGAGGAGAGGTVLLDAQTYTGTLNVDLSGGTGGDIDNVGPSNCNGPGGGGGGGMLWVSNITLPAEINLVNAGGASGTTLTATQTNCTVGSTNNATDGNPGTSLTDLSMLLPTDASGTDVQTVCDSLIWIDGNTYYTDTTSTFVMIGGASSGCDSTVTLDLTVNTVDPSITQLGADLTATQTGVTYQWIDCNSMSPIAGETNQNFTATLNGDYACIVTNGSCSDTSACINVSGVGFEDDHLTDFKVFPNPTEGEVWIDLGKQFKLVEVEIYDLSGRMVKSKSIQDTSLIQLDLSFEKGTYQMLIISDGHPAFVRLVVE
jgi:hypothetical protein